MFLIILTDNKVHLSHLNDECFAGGYGNGCEWQKQELLLGKTMKTSFSLWFIYLTSGAAHLSDMYVSVFYQMQECVCSLKPTSTGNPKAILVVCKEQKWNITASS